MGKKRKPREKDEGIDFSKPIDITKLGTSEDPCFGKLYDLSTDECKRCGDSELCALVFAQGKLKDKRTKIEKDNRFKDMELKDPVNKSLKAWVKNKKEEGLTRAEVIKKAKTTFGSTREEIKKVWKNL